MMINYINEFSACLEKAKQKRKKKPNADCDHSILSLFLCCTAVTRKENVASVLLTFEAYNSLVLYIYLHAILD